jgi:hypothetical protein
MRWTYLLLWAAVATLAEAASIQELTALSSVRVALQTKYGDLHLAFYPQVS